MMQGTAHGSADTRATLGYWELPHDGPLGATGFVSPDDTTALGTAVHISSTEPLTTTLAFMLARTVVGVSSVVGQFVHIQGITSTHAAQGTASAELDSAIGLRLTAHASGHSGGNLTVIWFLESRPHGQATASGTLPVAKGLGGRADGRSTVTPTATRIRSVAGRSSGRADAYAFFAESTLPYDWAMPATGFASPNDTTALGTAIHLSSSEPFTGMDTRVFIGGRSDAAATAGASLGKRNPVTARADGRATVAGDYHRVPTLGTGHLGSGTLGFPTDTVDVYLDATIAGRSTASAGLTGHRPMAARVTGVATTSAVVLRTRQLAVRVTSVAAVRGQFVNRRQVAVNITGLSNVAPGDLFRDAAGVLDTRNNPVVGRSTVSAGLPVSRTLRVTTTGVSTVRATQRLRRGLRSTVGGVATVRASQVRMVNNLFGSSVGISKNDLTLSKVTLDGRSAGLGDVPAVVLTRDVGLGGGQGKPRIRSFTQGSRDRITLPADIQVGDLILIGVGAYNSDFGFPSGWTSLHHSVGSSTYVDHHRVLGKIATASDAGSTVVFSFQFLDYTGITAIVIEGGALPQLTSSGLGGSGPGMTTGQINTDRPTLRVIWFSQMANSSPVPTFTRPTDTRRFATSDGWSGFHRTEMFVHDLPQIEGRQEQVDGIYAAFNSTSTQAGGSSGIILAIEGVKAAARIDGKGTADGTSFHRLRSFRGRPHGQGTGFGGMSGKPDLLLPLGVANGRGYVDANVAVTNPNDPVPVPAGRAELTPERLSFDL